MDLLGALGKTVMVSNYTRFDGVTGYLRKSTQSWIAMVMGVPTLREIFDEKYYTDLPGGILEGLGRLFQGNVKLFIYPTRETAAAKVDTADLLDVQPRQRSLYKYLLENGFIEAIQEFDADQLHITPKDVLTRLQSGDPAGRPWCRPRSRGLSRNAACLRTRCRLRRNPNRAQDPRRKQVVEFRDGPIRNHRCHRIQVPLGEQQQRNAARLRAPYSR